MPGPAAWATTRKPSCTRSADTRAAGRNSSSTVSPGPVATDPWPADDGVAATVSRATGGDPSMVTEGAANAMVTGRFSQPAEVADAVLFLAGARAANTVGTDLRVDGEFVPTWWPTDAA